MSLSKRSSRSTPAASAGGRNDGPSWEFMSPDSPLIKSLVADAHDAGRQGQPDPILGTGVPEVFARSNATFAQLAESVRKQAMAECAHDVAFLVENAVAFVAARAARPTSKQHGAIGDVGAERRARLESEYGACLGRLSTREEQHRAELGKLRSAAETTRALLKTALEDKHPHPDHLGHFTFPEFEMPTTAGDIGQRAVERALSRATQPHPSNTIEKE